MVKRVVAETGFSFSFIVYAVRKGKLGSEEGKNNKTVKVVVVLESQERVQSNTMPYKKTFITWEDPLLRRHKGL